MNKITTHILYSVCFPKIVLLVRYVEKYGTAGKATYDNIKRGLRCVNEATDTHPEYVIVTTFP